jgi:hypothetical protein
MAKSNELFDVNVTAERLGIHTALEQSRKAELFEVNGVNTPDFYDAVTLAYIANREAPAADFVQRRAGSSYGNVSLRAAVIALLDDDWAIALKALNNVKPSFLRDAAIGRVASDGISAIMKTYPGTTKEAAAERINAPPTSVILPDPQRTQSVSVAETITNAANLMRHPLERALE